MMKKILSALLLMILMSVAGTLSAADLQEAKRQGLIGERADGFLGLVKADAPSEVVELVTSVNEKRRTEYRKIAEANGITPEQVQALAGKKAIEMTETGGWIKLNGGWQQK